MNKAHNIPIEELLRILLTIQEKGYDYVNIKIMSDRDLAVQPVRMPGEDKGMSHFPDDLTQLT